jgi:hypothetical protein
MVLISNEIDVATAQARRKPVIDTVVYRVQRGVGTVDGNPRGGTTQ